MTDMEKVKKLLDELGIKYEVNEHTIYIDPFYCDGVQEWGVSFWDGDDLPDGKFHEFWAVGEDIDNRPRAIRMYNPDSRNDDAQSAWFCSRCNRGITHNDNYCWFCGAVIKTSQEAIDSYFKDRDL